MTRKAVAMCVLVVGLVATAWVSTTLADQTAGAGAKSAKPAKGIPRTAWGVPDLTGVWTGASLTRLQRSEQLKGREFFTDEEIQQMERKAAETQFDPDPVDANGKPTTQNGVGGYDASYFDNGIKVDPSKRTALIVDPADGRLPLTPEAVKRQRPYGKGPYDSYLDLDTGERCLGDGTASFVWFSYNPNHQITQTRDHIMFLHEMYTERRIVPLDGRPVPGKSVPQWSGTARGRWEGDTLVVETANFSDAFPVYRFADVWRAPSATLSIVERFTRLDAENMLYRITLTDPAKFTRPVTIETTLTTNQGARGVTEGPVLEYACHEGNIGGPGILAGEREAEKKKAGSR